MRFTKMRSDVGRMQKTTTKHNKIFNSNHNNNDNKKNRLIIDYLKFRQALQYHVLHVRKT